MFPGLSIAQKGLLVVGLVLALELGFFGVLFHLLAQSEYEIWHQSHVKSVLLETDTLIISAVDATVALGAYSNTRSSYFKKKAELAIEKIPLEVKSLHQLVEGYPQEQSSISNLEGLTTRALVAFRRTQRLLEEGNMMTSLMSAPDLQNEAESILFGLVTELEKFASQEKSEQIQLSQREAAARLALQRALVLAAAGQALMVIGLSLALSRGITGRIRNLVDNTNRLLKKQPLHKPVDGSDEIAQLDKMFHQMAENLAEAEMMKQEFVAIISHELRSPLSSIRNTLTLAAEGVYGDLSKVGIERLKTAEVNSMRLLGLINELLEIKKLEAGKLQMDFEEFPLKEIAQRAAETAEVIATPRSVVIELSMPVEPLLIVGDPRRIEQVMINLLSNAIKYSPSPGVVNFSVIQSKSLVEVLIEDHGAGIPPGYLQKIFEKYEQVDKPKDSNSTGLGLPIAKAIIEAHGGEIGVKSELSKGSIFWFKLPVDATEIVGQPVR